MHYTGTILLPPYEAYSMLIQVTAGCTHHSCKFCTLYEDLPFKFRLSPIEEVKDVYKRQSYISPSFSWPDANIQLSSKVLSVSAVLKS